MPQDDLDFSKLSDEQLEKLSKSGVATDFSVLSRPGQPLRDKTHNFTPQEQTDIGNNLEHWINKGLFGAAVGAGTLASGGLGAWPAAAGMGLFSALTAPENATDALTNAAGFGLAGPAMKAENLMAKFGLPGLAKAGIRGAEGYAQHKLGEGINTGFGHYPGENPPSDTFGTASSVALPMLLGGMADKIQASPVTKQKELHANIQDTINQLAGKSAPVGPQMEQNSGVGKGIKTILKNIETNTQIAKTQQEMAARAAKEVPALQQQKADTLITPLEGLDKTAKLAAIDANINKLHKYMPDDPNVKQLKMAQDARTKVEQGINPFSGQPLPPEMKDSVLSDITRLSEQAQNQIVQSKTAQLQAASEKYAQSQPAPPNVQPIFDIVGQDAIKNPLENIYLKSLVAPSADGAPMTARTFLNNVMNSDSEHIDALYKYLKTQGVNGTKMQGHMQDAFISEFFNKAYDPQTKTLTNAGKLFAADGPFNKPKVEAMFGGGEKGAEKARQFASIVDDIRALTDLQKQPQGPGGWAKFGKSQIVAAATGFILSGLGVPHFAAGATGEALGSLVGFIPSNKLISGMMTNPNLAKALHEWAANGGSGTAFKMNPGLSKWLDQNIHPFGQ